MKGCSRCSTSIFWILPSLAKYPYGWLPFKKHHKIEKENTKPTHAICQNPKRFFLKKKRDKRLK